MQYGWGWVLVGGFLSLVGFASQVSALPMSLRPVPPMNYYQPGVWGGMNCGGPACAISPIPYGTCPPQPNAYHMGYALDGVATPGPVLAPFRAGNGKMPGVAEDHPPAPRPLNTNIPNPAGSDNSGPSSINAILERLDRIEELLIRHEKYLQQQRDHR